MTFTDDLVYGVLIQKSKQTGGGWFLSHGKDAAPALFWKRVQAMIHRAEIAKECNWPLRKMKIVKVKAEYTIL